MTTEAPPAWQHRQEILGRLRAYRQSQILITCAEIGVFEALSSGPCTPADLSARLGATEHGISRLLHAAAALGFVEKHGEMFSNSPVAQTCLAGEGDFYIGNFVKREGAFYRRWGNLTEAVLTGRRPEENTRDEDPDAWVWGFEQALYDLSRAVAPLIAEALDLPEDRHLRVLDVGGGHGGYSLALAKRYPNLSATVFELPRVVPVAQHFIAQAGLSDRVSVQEGDFQVNDLGGGYDLVLLFGVLVGESTQGRAALIQKVYQALKPGGQVALREFALNPDRTSPPEAALFALQMLLATDNGGASTTEELSGWLLKAGFRPPRPVSLPEWAGTNLILSEKPA